MVSRYPGTIRLHDAGLIPYGHILILAVEYGRNPPNGFQLERVGIAQSESIQLPTQHVYVTIPYD